MLKVNVTLEGNMIKLTKNKLVRAITSIFYAWLCAKQRRSSWGILVWARPSVRSSLCPSISLSVNHFACYKIGEPQELGTFHV